MKTPLTREGRSYGTNLGTLEVRVLPGEVRVGLCGLVFQLRLPMEAER